MKKGLIIDRTDKENQAVCSERKRALTKTKSPAKSKRAINSRVKLNMNSMYSFILGGSGMES
jgi:hypothetical protein